MVFKVKIPRDLQEREIAIRTEEEKRKIIAANPELHYIGAACEFEAEDIQHGQKTILITFDDVD